MTVADWQMRLNADGYSLNVDGVAGPLTYAALFSYMGAKDTAPAFGKGAAVYFPAFQITTGLRIAHWMAQFGVESANFTRFEENLNYSAQRLCAVWPNRFPNLAAAEPYAGNPEALANAVYGGRMGNDQPGDGWKYRGRGPGLTGKANYAACGMRTHLDLLSHPELAANPTYFALIGGDFWVQHGCNPLADADDLRGVTLKINGGYNGIADRANLLNRALRVLE